MSGLVCAVYVRDTRGGGYLVPGVGELCLRPLMRLARLFLRYDNFVVA
jgi:hypothetical protein